ncbi:DNA modification methylase [Mucilaginibacter oryzae]|uniref:Methyltransferase n=1 Tax=Mucilaginibacter oryzae TaxID=468058 RepID=A0A316HKS8_9SPHI|nr:site-specific DNA-methyltransferase [Mucilaginibacter oryzae]PWK80630.1 DNA modification methylase [Mucilaginibacter oryzae]
MAYYIQDIQEQFSIVEEEIVEYALNNKIKIGKNGAISDRTYQTIFDFYSKETDDVHKPVLILNGNKIEVKDKPVFESENKRISIFRDDSVNFLKNLPTASVDVIITDPAYSGMNQKLKFGKGKIIGKYSDAGKSDAKWFEEFHDTEENYKAFLKECNRVLKKNRHIYIMFDSYSLLTLAPIVRDVFDVKNILCWDKVNIGLGHYFRRRHEFIMFASKGKRPLNSKNIPDVWRIKRVVASKYPTQKPTEVFELMLKGSAEKDFVVCDPFLGSGSSAIAAIKNNCKFLGCDISEKSISFSKERIEHFLNTQTDIYQKSSLLGNDEAMTKLFGNG